MGVIQHDKMPSVKLDRGEFDMIKYDRYLGLGWIGLD